MDAWMLDEWDKTVLQILGINMTSEKSQMPNLDTYLVLMPLVLVGAGCPQGPASTCCAFQPIIYPKVQQVHTLIFDAFSNGI